MLDQLLGSVSIFWALNASGQMELRRWAWGASALTVQSHAVTRSASYRPVSRAASAIGAMSIRWRADRWWLLSWSAMLRLMMAPVWPKPWAILPRPPAMPPARPPAQAAANLANAGLADIAADNVLTPGEKPQVVLNYNVLVTEHAGIDGQAAPMASPPNAPITTMRSMRCPIFRV
jgi:hypothetical protein